MNAFPDRFAFVRNAKGQPVEHLNVKKGDAVYASLEAFLRQQEAGWTPTVATYVPMYYFSSDVMTINCGEHLVVVNFKDDESKAWSQIIKKIDGCSDVVDSAIRIGQSGPGSIPASPKGP